MIFEELKESVEKTYGRRFEVSNFQQILYIAPDFYSYQWVKKPRAYQQYTLNIDFGSEVNGQLS